MQRTSRHDVFSNRCVKMKMLTLFAFISFFTSLISAENVSDEELQLYRQSVLNFTNKIYQKQREETNGSFIISPLCMQSVLALMHAGAKGKTALEIAQGFSLPTEQVQNIYTKILAKDQSNSDYQLYVYHKIYVQQGDPISDSFNTTARHDYKADIKFLDFIGDTENAYKELNKDTADAVTIQKFLSPNETTEFNFFIYSSFLFRSLSILDCPVRRRLNILFHTNDDETKEIEVVELIAYFNYFESDDLDAKFLQLPYKNGEAVITMVLPNKQDGLVDLEERLPEVLEFKNFTKRKVIFQFPDFNSKSSLEVSALFKKIGVRAAFDIEKADFTKIRKSKPIHMSALFLQVFHGLRFEWTDQAKMIIKLFESVNPQACPSSDGAAEFIVDRPHLHMLSLKESGSIVTIARVTDPEEAARKIK